MKILTNKKYNKLTENLDLYKKIVYAKDITIEKNNKKIDRANKMINTTNQLNEKLKESIAIIEKAYIKKFNEWLNVKKELTNVKKAKGGYNKQINRLQDKVNQLQKELKETNQKLKESMTDKYLVKKIPSGKRPKTIFTKINNSSVQSNIVKNMHKEV